MDISTLGIVIKEQMQGENDKLLTILTPEHGKVFAYAKGVKKLSSKNAPACQLFVLSEFDLIKTNSRLTVKTAVSKEMFYAMRSDMTRFSLACYFAEILAHVTTENNDETDALRLFLNTLFALSNKSDVPLWQIKASFELKIMCICGLMPDLDTCFGCGCEIVLSNSNTFSFEEAAPVCDRCKKSNSAFTCTLSKDVCLAMKFITASSLSNFLSYKLEESYAAELSFVCENYLLHKTERPYETLRIYKSIISSLGEK